MTTTNNQSTLKPWSPLYARTLGALALIMPIVGALLYHVDGLSDIGQARFFISVRGAFIMASLASMLFMPRAFLRILDSKGVADEHELHRRATTFHTAYRLTILVALVLIVIAASAANDGLGGKDMRHLLVTIGSMILAYAMIIPFNILAWTMTPPDEE